MIPLGVLASALVEAAAGGTTGFVTSRKDPTGGAARTYAAVNLGTAAANRNVIIIAHARYRGILSATIAGVTATLVQGFTDAYAHVAVFTAEVPTGTTGNVVITHGTSAPEADAIGVFAAYGTLTYNTHATSGTTNTVTLTAPSNALVVAGLSDIQSPNTFAGALSDYFVAAERVNYMDCTGQLTEPAAGSYTVTVPTRNGFPNYALLAVAFTLT